MATQTQTLTNAQALAQAADLAAQAGMADLAAKLSHMADVAAKPRAKSSEPTKQQLVNADLARQVARWVCAQADPVSSADVVKGLGIPQVGSTQKASYLLKTCAQAGWVVRIESKSRVLWGAGATPVV